MTTFDYSSGDPANLVAGGAASMSDVAGSFADIRTFLNGGNIDATNLATSADPVTLLGQYRTIAEATHQVANGAVSGAYIPTLGVSIRTGASARTSAPPVLITLTSDSYSISGLTTKLRISSTMATNATAPAINFTYGLYPVTFAGGASALTVTAGTVVSGSTVARNTPAASSTFQNSTSDFNMPTDGIYVLGVSLSGTAAANCYVAMSMRLEVRHV